METVGPYRLYVIDTSSGKRLNLDDPRPEDIRVTDVAGGRYSLRTFCELREEVSGLPTAHSVEVR